MFRKTMAELDSLDITLLLSHARERLHESKVALNAEIKAGHPDSIPACMARESIQIWSTTTKRLQAAMDTITAEIEADRKRERARAKAEHFAARL